LDYSNLSTQQVVPLPIEKEAIKYYQAGSNGINHYLRFAKLAENSQENLLEVEKVIEDLDSYISKKALY